MAKTDAHISIYLDKNESNYTGCGQKDRQTRTEILTRKIYEFVKLNAVTRGVTERQILMARVIINTF